MKKSLLKGVLCILVSLPIYTNAMTLEEYIAQENPEDASYIAESIFETSNAYGLDPLFMASIFYVESRYHNDAVSPVGAEGIAQLMPGTAYELGVDPSNIYQNIEGGTRYFRELLDMQDPTDPYRYNLALASYNAGPGSVNGVVPTYTYDYIRMIQEEYDDILSCVDTNFYEPSLEKPAPVKRERKRRKKVVQPEKKQDKIAFDLNKKDEGNTIVYVR